MKALVTLSSGDMRRALNILQVPFCHLRPHSWPTGRELFLPPPLPQSTSMAFGKVTEENVYTCTGHPLKADIANILDWMLNQNFSTAYRSILCSSALGLSPVGVKSSLPPAVAEAGWVRAALWEGLHSPLGCWVVQGCVRSPFTSCHQKSWS